jgi:hypothetical protein
MNSQQAVAFQWGSPLGISVILFLLYGGVYALIGILAPLLLDSESAGRLLIVSYRTDSIVFGQSPPDLLRSDAALAKLRTILFFILAGFMLTAGSFHLVITWFGLRQGQTWALVALTLVGFAVLPFWFLALRPYFRQGVNLTLLDIPPFMWVPTALLLPAVVLGWIGLTF